VFSRSRCLTAVAVVSAALTLGSVGTAQDVVTRGFDQVAKSVASYNEVNRQRDIQVMEVQIKPMRIVFVPVTDKDGQQRLEQVWYLVYRAINRPLRVEVTDESDPVNVLDPLPGPAQFVPSLTLVTHDDPKTEIPIQILPDEIIPAALAEIRKIEGDEVLDCVEVTQDFPKPVDPDADEQPWIYGVAMWRNVDPETDFFKVIFRGFSNGYERTDDNPSGIARKVVVQKFKRPGDRYDPNLREFSYDGAPFWAYQPDKLKVESARLGGPTLR
jgi:hypothetical protein